MTAALLTSLLTPLTGCDPSDAPATNTSLTITPSLGMVRNATVVVKNTAGAVVGSGSTGSTGTVTLTASGRGPYVIEVQGDNDAEYFDESANAFLPFVAPRVIHALVPTGSTNVGVTGLTDIAHALWAANSVPLSNANITAANNAVLNSFAAGSGLPSILVPPTALSSTPANTLTNSAGDIYAAILAGLADLGASAPGGTPPALTVIEQLRRDVSDGSIDGQEGSTAINPLYGTSGFAANFQTRVDNRINTLGNTSLQAVTLTVTALTEPTWSGGSTGGGGDLPATVNSGLYGSYTLTFTRGLGIAASAVPYVDGQEYSASIAAGGVLMIAGSTYTAPFYRTVSGVPATDEAVWFGMPLNLEFAVSNNDSGVFNEINVFNPFPSSGTGIPQFLGQFTVSTGGGDPVDCIANATTLFADKAGSYTFTAGSLNGAAASLFTSSNTYTATVSAQGGITLQGNGSTSYLFQDYFEVQDCATTPRVRYYPENGLPYTVTLTFDAADSRNATLTLSNNSNSGDNATFSGVPASTGGGTSPAADPAYNPLGERNGISLTIGNHTWQMDSEVTDPRYVSGTNTREVAAENAYIYNSSGQAIALADMTSVTGTGTAYLFDAAVTINHTIEGEQLCGGDVKLVLSANISGDSVFTASSCRLIVDYTSFRGGIGGRILEATLSNTSGMVITVSSGQFRAYRHRGTTGDAPATPAGSFGTMQIDTGTFEFAGNQHFVLDSTDTNSTVGSSFSYGTITDDGTVGRKSRSTDIALIVANDGFFDTAINSYSCGTRYTGLPTNRMNMQLWLGTYQFEHVYNSANGGNCTITMDQRSGQYHKASFTATLINNDALNSGVLTDDERRVIISGEFRNFMALPYEAGNGGSESALASQPADTRAADMTVDDGNVVFTGGERFLIAGTDMSGWLSADRFQASFSYGNSYDLNNGSEEDERLANGNNGFDLRIFSVPRGTGTYLCGTGYPGATTTIYPQVFLSTERVDGLTTGRTLSNVFTLYPGASCSITVTRFDGTAVEGTYTATLVNSDLAGIVPGGDGTMTISGSFRWKGTDTP